MGHAIPLTRFASPLRSRPDEVMLLHRQLAADEAIANLLAGMPVNIIILNEHRQIVYANRAFQALALAAGCTDYLGRRPGEVFSCTNARSESGCGTAEACRLCGTIATVLSTLGGKGATEECRILRETPHGPEALDLRVTGRPFPWRGDQLVMVTFVDIGDEKRRRVMERIFFHDLINTVSIISTLADLFREGQIEPELVKKELWETSQVLINEIKGQRDLLAAENGELHARFALVQSLSVLDMAMSMYRKSELAAGKTIRLAEESTPVQFVGDTTILLRVLGNMLKNALEASCPGDDVTLGCRQEGESLLFWCHNPAAMSREVQLQMFQRSFSTKGKDRGVGTYSIKLLTEKYLQGRVSFTSTPQTGTTFQIFIPSNPLAG